MQKLLAVLVLVLLAGCSDDPLGPEALAGTYDLVAIDGDPLPYELFNSVVTSGSLDLRADGTFRYTEHLRTEDVVTGEETSETESEAGTYHMDGSTLRFDFENDVEATGVVRDDELTVDAGLLVLLFRRRDGSSAYGHP